MLLNKTDATYQDSSKRTLVITGTFFTFPPFSVHVFWNQYSVVTAFAPAALGQEVTTKRE